MKWTHFGKLVLVVNLAFSPSAVFADKLDTAKDQLLDVIILYSKHISKDKSTEEVSTALAHIAKAANSYAVLNGKENVTNTVIFEEKRVVDK